MPIRVVTTGQMHGPELADAIALIGKDKAIERVAKFVK
ncbi:Glutamate--tRNA ligase OS=Ureibacillus acetophenoni OX=614649 GN=gltX PE=3 SV=1 [Ureibacillus acetophenoni]